MSKPKVIVIAGSTAVRQDKSVNRACKKGKWRNSFSRFNANI